MRYWITSIAALAILFAGNIAYAEESNLPTFETEYNFRKVYIFKPKFKAMAVGLSGTFGTSWSNRNAKEAAANAISACRKGFASLKRRDGTDSKCRLVVVGDKPLKNEAVSLASWQVPAAGEDKPLSRGFKSLLPNKEARGILLAVHGCDGLGSSTYNSAWGDYYNASGLDFYAPDSFADSRPPAICGSHRENGLHLVSEVFRLRIAQTHRTIEYLREANPGVPIYLWGHSEGSLIVQAIEAKVDGIIVSGDECGALGMPVAADSTVPFLYVLGADDKAVEGMSYPFSENSLRVCQKYMGGRKWKVAVVKNNGHLIWPWRRTAAEAIAKFVGANWHKVAQLQVTGRVSLTSEGKIAFETYKKKNGHRAFAAEAGGDFSWGADWDYAEDAAQFALFNCAKHNGFNVFASGRHHCALIDIDGEDQQKDY